MRHKWLVAVALAALVGAGSTVPAQATFPGTNADIFFIRSVGGVTNVYRTSSSFGPVVQVTTIGGVLTAGGAGFQGPSVSPDGTTVAFATAAGINTVPAGGGPTTLVTGSLAGDHNPTWHPNGTQLVLQAAGGLFTLPAAGGARTLITGTVAGDDGPDVSPNGATIAFRRAVGGVGEIFTVPFAGGSVTQLTSCPNGRDGCYQPTFKPDGSQIALTFDSDVTRAGGCPSAASRYRIGIISSTGGGQVPSPILGSQFGDITPSWSPDMTAIAVDNCLGATLHSLATIGVPGGARVVPSFPSLLDFGPFWSRSAAPTTPSNTPPTFSATSACGSTVMAPIIGAPVTVNLSASDTAGQVVSLTAAGVPTYGTFTPTNGNPATATLRLAPSIFNIFDIFGPGSTVTVTATDNGTPVASAACALTARVRLF